MREWFYQRGGGTKYQIWHPPGVVFSRLKKDYYEHGRMRPPWEKWGFGDEPASPVRLVLGAMAGRWVMRQALTFPNENWVVAEGDEARFFLTFHRAMNSFGFDAEEPRLPFPNLRLVFTNERFAPSFVPQKMVHSVHVHMPWPERTSRPERKALINAAAVQCIAEAMEEQGELHIVADDDSIIGEACGTLAATKLFMPCLGFPYYCPGVPLAYTGGRLLEADLASTRREEGAAKAPISLFYSKWEKRPPMYPNWRFSGRTLIAQ